jgi:hypothetical protein
MGDEVDSAEPMGDSLVVKRLLVLCTVSFILVGALAPTGAQGRYVRLDGWVQWIAADKMVLVLDGGPSVAIDITQIPLDQYRTLRQRDRVTVTGVVSDDNRRVNATSIIPGGGGGVQSP